MKLHHQPTLTLFCGLPGSGKTTLAKRLEQMGKGIRICTDEWREYFEIDHRNEEFHEKLQARLYELALTLLRNGQDVILEDGLWQKAERSQKLADAKSCNARTEMHFSIFLLTKFGAGWRREMPNWLPAKCPLPGRSLRDIGTYFSTQMSTN